MIRSDDPDIIAMADKECDFQAFYEDRFKMEFCGGWLSFDMDEVVRKPTEDDLRLFNSKTLNAWRSDKKAREERAQERRKKFFKGFPKRAADVALTTTVADPTIALVEPHAKQHQGIFVLSGPVGVGKTVSACWLAWQQPYLPEFIRASDIVTASRYDDTRTAADKYRSGVVVDDLGTEYLDAKGNGLAMLDEFVDSLYGDKMWCCITTNLAPTAFAKRYGTRITDRLREAGVWISVTGESRRGKR